MLSIWVRPTVRIVNFKTRNYAAMPNVCIPVLNIWFGRLMWSRVYFLLNDSFLFFFLSLAIGFALYFIQWECWAEGFWPGQWYGPGNDKNFLIFLLRAFNFSFTPRYFYWLYYNGANTSSTVHRQFKSYCILQTWRWRNRRLRK